MPQDSAAQSLAPAEQVAVRDVADGAGPSHVIAIGRYVLVVDPWSSEIRRYAADDLQAPPALCRFPRDFAPGRTQRTATGIRLIAEPYGPGEADDYDLRSRQAMTISTEAVGAMAAEGPCRFPIGRYNAEADTPPAIRWEGVEAAGAAALFPLPGGGVARIAPEGGAGARIFAVRDAGALSGGRTLLWWSEIDDTPEDTAAGDFSGRLMASQYVGIMGQGGGAPEAVIRIETAVVPPLVADAAIPVSAMLVKPGLEYVAGSSAGAGASLWIVAADMDAPAPRAFVLRRYDLSALTAGSRALIALVPPSRNTVPLIDRNDPAPGEGGHDAPPAKPLTGPLPFARAAALARQQIAHRWQYPVGAAQRPCGGADRGPVGANASGALGTGPGFDVPVTDLTAPDGGAEWMRPRHLIGVQPGADLRGVPYSIGGEDLVPEFAARLGAGYGSPASAGLAPPVGHIREGMEWPAAEGHYPLGIDCSALVARIFDVGVRSTAHMVSATTFTAADGRRYSLPTGPHRGCPLPVRRFADLRRGDLFLRNGHIVIFNGFTYIGNAPGRAQALRVFEATSRCGVVCESVYDPTYFAGWWMLRLDPANCPDWLEAAPLSDPDA